VNNTHQNSPAGKQNYARYQSICGNPFETSPKTLRRTDPREITRTKIRERWSERSDIKIKGTSIHHSPNTGDSPLSLQIAPSRGQNDTLEILL
jgi:hypothetical protein